jgi:hypothetical protein
VDDEVVDGEVVGGEVTSLISKIWFNKKIKITGCKIWSNKTLSK